MTNVDGMTHISIYSKLPNLQEPKKEQNSPCFIATLCYGDFNAPEVLLLRRYRDDILLKYSIGRIAIKFYYFISPSIARAISKSNKFKWFVKTYLLNPIVTKLKKNFD